MTNPLREIDSRESDNESHETLVVPPPEAGRQATRQKTLSETAGDASSDAPQQFSQRQVFDLLVSAISTLDGAGKMPVAAGVSAKMRLLQPTFSLPRSPYRTFRELVLDAESRGVVDVSAGANDLVLKIGEQKKHDSRRGETLRTDLWRALLDWTNGVVYEYDPKTCDTRRAGAEPSEGTVAVPFLSKDERLAWMRTFAAAETGPQAAELNEALRGEDAVASFHRVVRATDSLKRRWNRHLRRHVLEAAHAWARQHGIPDGDILADATARVNEAAPGESHPPTASTASDEEIRQRVLGILGAMPLHELLRLHIPLEYSLTR